MNMSSPSNQSMPDAQSPPAMDGLAVDTLPGNWNGRLFYLFSAGLHVVALLALSGSWLVWSSTGQKASPVAEVPSEPKPTVVRMAIDVGPVKFCDMTIEGLIGQRQSGQPQSTSR